jgi:hypothetical protein
MLFQFEPEMFSKVSRETLSNRSNKQYECIFLFFSCHIFRAAITIAHAQEVFMQVICLIQIINRHWDKNKKNMI